MFPNQPLPADVLELLRQGHTIEAIKALRAHGGLGLKEAKDAIDAHLRGEIVSMTQTPRTPLPADVIDALQRGNKVEAIKLLREQTCLGLAEAKHAIEAAQSGQSKQGRAEAKLAPGEVAKSGGGLWWLIALAVAGLAAALFLI